MNFFQEKLDDITDSAKNILKNFINENTYKVGDFAVRPALTTDWYKGEAIYLRTEILYKGAVVDSLYMDAVETQQEAEEFLKGYSIKLSSFDSYEDSLKLYGHTLKKNEKALEIIIQRLKNEHLAKEELVHSTVLFKEAFGVPEYNDNGELEGYQYEGKFYKYSKVIETIEDLDKFLEYVEALNED